MFTLFCLFVIVFIALFGVWSFLRMRRCISRPLRWLGDGAAVVLTLITASVAALMIVGMIKLHSRSAPRFTLAATPTAARRERGAQIATSLCTACHSHSGLMQGGEDMGKKMPLSLGSFVPANLTPAGPLRHWSDSEVFRAIRNAVDADGRLLLIMSYTNTGKLSDEDTLSVIAYLRSLPAAGPDSADPVDQLTPLGLTMLGAGLLPPGKPVVTGAITAPPPGPTAQYGGYLVGFNDCRECHGSDLMGHGANPLSPPAPGLGNVRAWTAAQFAATLRGGIDPSGHELSDQMPWRTLGKMTDDDLTAIYELIAVSTDPEGQNSNQSRASIAR
jgi:mono/diheme cytochrome c family protein